MAFRALKFASKSIGNMQILKDESCEHKILETQQLRSYQYNQVNALDIWDSKNMFRNAMKKCLRTLNMNYNTIEELEVAVLEMMKLWINKDMPKPVYLKGPWLIYRNRCKMTRTDGSNLAGRSAFSFTD